MTLWWCWGLLSTPKPSLFPADPDQLPQSLLMGQVLQPYHPGNPPLSSLQFVHVFPVLGPKTGLSIWMMWCEECHTQGDNPFPWPLSQFRSCWLPLLSEDTSVVFSWWPSVTSGLHWSPILWQCHCRGHHFQVPRKYLHQAKMLQNLIILTTAVNKEWRCFCQV